jgi:hypothetical protein
MFVNEVGKGSHLKPATIPKFRADALKALCEVVQENLEKLVPEPEVDDEDGEEDGDSWDDKEGAEEEDDDDPVLSGEEAEPSSKEAPSRLANPENRKRMTKEQISQIAADELAQEQQQHKDLIGKVYQSSEAQFKSRLQLLVHQYRQKEKKARKI